jgi:hypothetical protein
MGKGKQRAVALILFAISVFIGIGWSSEHANASTRMLENMRSWAIYRGLPTLFFDDLIAYRTEIAFKVDGSYKGYKPGGLYGGTIWMPELKNPVKDWGGRTWMDFYHELFHAWWGNVLNKQSVYASYKNYLQKHYKNKYQKANWYDSTIAQEEAYAETIARLVFYRFPREIWETELGSGNKLKLICTTRTPLFRLGYIKSDIIAAASHSDEDRPQYNILHGTNFGGTSVADDIYPDEKEYEYLFAWMFHKLPPTSPESKVVMNLAKNDCPPVNEN